MNNYQVIELRVICKELFTFSLFWFPAKAWSQIIEDKKTEGVEKKCHAFALRDFIFFI